MTKTLNRILPASALAAVMFTASSSTQADVLGVYAGGGLWQTDLSGDVGDAGQPAADLEDLGLDDEDSNFFYVALEHPIPIIPNARLQLNDINLSNTATVSQSFVIDGDTFTAGTEVASDIDLTHTDATLYYEVLDNVVSLDLGLTFRMFDGSFEVTDTTTNETATEDFDDTVPLLYGKVQGDLPLTGFYVAASGNYINYDDNSIFDYQAGVGYMTDGWVLDLGLELGYRSFSLEIDADDLGDVNADGDVSGAYLSANIHF